MLMGSFRVSIIQVFIYYSYKSFRKWSSFIEGFQSMPFTLKLIPQRIKRQRKESKKRPNFYIFNRMRFLFLLKFRLILLMQREDLEILYLHKKLKHLHERQEKKKFLRTVNKHDFGKIIKFWREAILKGRHDEQIIHTTYVVKQILIEYSASDHYLEDIKPNEVDALAKYMETTKLFEDCLNIIDILYLQRGIHTITKGEHLFKVLIQNFEHLENDEVRQIATENIIELMKENPAYIPMANHPYYFLEYLLHLINQEQNTDKSLYWFQLIKQIYILPDAEKNLFHQSDFRILIDVLVRHIENFSNEKELITYIEAYLVLSISPYIIKSSKYYKLDMIILVINDIPHPSEVLRGYANELQSLSLQAM